MSPAPPERLMVSLPRAVAAAARIAGLLVAGVGAGGATMTAPSEGGSGRITVTAPPSQIAGGSIVYIKDGDVWLADPVGAAKRQLTASGGYRSPSMADDGIVGALRDRGATVEFVRLSPSGAVVGSFTWPFGNPVREAALSPDGRTFAHVYSAACGYHAGPGSRQCWRLAFTPAQSYREQEATGTFDSMDYVAIVWLSNRHLMVTGGANFFAVEVYVRGAGVDLTSADRFVSDDYKIFRAALTPDGHRMVAWQRRFLGFDGDGNEILGPQEVGIYRHVGPAQYGLEELAERSVAVTGPTVSPDAKAWAFADDGGIWLHVFGQADLINLDPLGSEPQWGSFTLR